MIKNDDLINDFEVMLEQTGWLNALFSSIKSDLAAGRIYQAKQLASLGQYLAEEGHELIQTRLENLTGM